MACYGDSFTFTFYFVLMNALYKDVETAEW
jgi:hypothetical protein